VSCYEGLLACSRHQKTTFATLEKTRRNNGLPPPRIIFQIAMSNAAPRPKGALGPVNVEIVDYD